MSDAWKYVLEDAKRELEEMEKYGPNRSSMGWSRGYAEAILDADRMICDVVEAFSASPLSEWAGVGEWMGRAERIIGEERFREVFKRGGTFRHYVREEK